MPAPINFATIAHGPILIGFTFNAILLGVMITQVYLYYTSFKKDKKWLKIYVAVLFVLDIYNTAAGAAYLYTALITHFNDPAYLDNVTWLFDMDPAITGVIVTMVQSFFAWRIWVLTKSYIFPILILATAITGAVTAIATPIKVSQDPHFTHLLAAKVPISIWLSSEVLGDILITVILVVYLSKHKTGFERSDLLVDRIIRLTVQTGLITSIVALLNLIVYLADTTGLHLLFNFMLCKLYSNSLMSTLNSRGVWMSGPSGMSQGKDSEDHSQSAMHNTYRAQIVQPPPVRPSEIISFNGKKHTEVFVNVESHELQDNSHLRSQLPLGKGAFDDKGSF
ncbi:hypothetical protein BDN70DRAFT_873897 [Pholiota conissans]|uniref:DUF6534 domain-containing protein n=1 Tax=Pholiota conissans TaxID=109636 RepID=A0A9P5Z9G8_9AGAR|nr:hypothetical protein BDN70DRAFT_873897 [Pholiota conissans]